MRYQLAPELIHKLKKADVRTRKKFKKALEIFFKDHLDPELDNHELKRAWEGFKSIDVTADLRAIYQEDESGDAPVAYFVALGTHEKLFKDK